MKKFASVIICGFLVLFLTGCEKGLMNDSQKKIITNFENIAEIEEYDKKYECKIIHTPEGMNTIIFEKPNSLKGLTFVWEGGKYTVSMNELSGEFNMEPLCEKSGIGTLMKIMDTLNDVENLKFSSKQEGQETFKGKVEGIEYEVIIDSEGKVLHIIIPEIKLRADFSPA